MLLDTVSEVISQAELLSDMVYDSFKPDIAPFLAWALDDVEQCLDSRIDFAHMRRLCLSFLGVWLDMTPAVDGPNAYDEDCPSRRHLIGRMLKLEAKLRLVGQESETALHLSCDPKTTESGPYPPHRFPSVNTTTYLTRIGMPANVLNARRQTALHVACRKPTCETSLVLCRALVDSGVYMHVRDAEGKTALEYARESGGKEADAIVMELQAGGVARLTLSTLAAQCVMRHHIDYKGVVPRRLEAFVGLH